MKDVVTIVIFVISLIVSSVVVNKIQQMYMSFIGTEMMFFSKKKKLAAIVVIGLLITGVIYKLFGLM